MKTRFRAAVLSLTVTGGMAAAACMNSTPAFAATVSAAPAGSAQRATAFTQRSPRAAVPQHRREPLYTMEEVYPPVPGTRPDARALGIDDAGNLLVNDLLPHNNPPLHTSSFRPLVGTRKLIRELDISGLGGAEAQAIAPNGTVVGVPAPVASASRDPASSPTALIWSRKGFRTAFEPASSRPGMPAAVNSDGIVVGTLEPRARGIEAYYGPPEDIKVLKTANFASLAGISEDGHAAGTVRPGYGSPKPYLTGVVFERHSLKAINANTPNVIDAISPNGRHIVGRIGVGSDLRGGTLAWLSTTSPPKPIKGAGVMVARDVSDRGEIVGSSRGHATPLVRGPAHRSQLRGRRAIARVAPA